MISGDSLENSHLWEYVGGLDLTENFSRTSGRTNVDLSHPAEPPPTASSAYVGETVVTALEYTMPPCTFPKLIFDFYWLESRRCWSDNTTQQKYCKTRKLDPWTWKPRLAQIRTEVCAHSVTKHRSKLTQASGDTLLVSWRSVIYLPSSDKAAQDCVQWSSHQVPGPHGQNLDQIHLHSQESSL